MTPLYLYDTDPADLDADAVVVGIFINNATEAYESDDTDDTDAAVEVAGPLLASGAESVAAAFNGRLANTLALLGATGSVGEVTKLATLGAIRAPVLAAVGLGDLADLDSPEHETIRRAAAAAVRALAGTGKVAFALPAASPEAMRACVEGALLGRYRFGGYQTRTQVGRRGPVRSVGVHVADATNSAATAEMARALVVADAVTLTRNWVNTPANDLRPPTFAEQVEAAGHKAGLEVDVLDEKTMREEGFGGILAVGMGSDAPPRLVRLAYRVPGANRHVALIGKGITFDTGGYAVKPPVGMWEMKSDMSGAAAIAAVMVALTELKPNVDVTAYLPMAENMISGTAYRPGDIVTMYGGKRVEVLNTDAEGRMILADAIAKACEEEPDYLIETSTLTGGQVVALGKRVAGLMGDPRLCERVRAVGERVGEPGWPMPLPDEVRKSMESDVADICQTSANMERVGTMLQGGVFLREFVPAGIPWVHIDIAGPAYHSGEPTGYLAKGGTGVPVRTLLELIEDIAANG